MRIYVAAPWTHKLEARVLADVLEAAGHTLTKKWWEHREVPGYLRRDITQEAHDELTVQALEDLQGVADADAFILLNLEKSEGKAVETGVALTAYTLRLSLADLGIEGEGPTRFILIGGKSNLFHYLPVWEEYTNVESMLIALDPDVDFEPVDKVLDRVVELTTVDEHLDPALFTGLPTQ